MPFFGHLVHVNFIVSSRSRVHGNASNGPTFDPKVLGFALVPHKNNRRKWKGGKFVAKHLSPTKLLRRWKTGVGDHDEELGYFIGYEGQPESPAENPRLLTETSSKVGRRQ